MFIWLIANWETIAAALTAVAAVANNFKDRGAMKEMAEMFGEQEQSNTDILHYAQEKTKKKALSYLTKKLL